MTARWLFGLAGFALILTSIVRLRVDGLTVLGALFLFVFAVLCGALSRSFWYRG